jgi:hypothetical protein
MRRESTGAATELERTESRERQELGYLPARAPRRQPPNRHPSPLRRRTLDGASKEGTTPMAPPPPNPADFGLSPEAGVGGRGGWDFSGPSRVNGAQQQLPHWMLKDVVMDETETTSIGSCTRWPWYDLTNYLHSIPSIATVIHSTTFGGRYVAIFDGILHMIV